MRIPMTPAILAVGCMVPALAWAADPELEGRIGRLERIIANQSGSELVLQMQRLQSEIQSLRGLIEQQGLEIERLKRQQRELLESGSRWEASSAPSRPTAVEMKAGEGATGETEPAPSAAPEPPSPPVEPVPPPSGGIPALPPPETAVGDERALYLKAFNLFKERKYQEARPALDEFLRRYPQGRYADSARYWLAESHYLLRDYPAALSEYERLVQLHPQSPKAPAALLKIGLIHDEQKQTEAGRAALERLLREYPNTSEAQLARERLEREGRTSR